MHQVPANIRERETETQRQNKILKERDRQRYSKKAGRPREWVGETEIKKAGVADMERDRDREKEKHTILKESIIDV